MFDLDSLLVPVDFSPTSRAALDEAVKMASGENPVVIVLHVIDRAQVAFIAGHEFGTEKEVAARLREQAEGQLAQAREQLETETEIETIICEGVPFLEIIRKAEEFQVGAIVMGKYGVRGHLEKLLFGTTAERVLRGATRPVIVLSVNHAT
jgi:nucleotide-binding universal stress UspA family protein